VDKIGHALAVRVNILILVTTLEISFIHFRNMSTYFLHKRFRLSTLCFH